MFGFRRQKPDHYAELLEYLTDHWQMKPRYAAAFCNAYRDQLSAGLEKLWNTYRSLSDADQLRAYHEGGDPIVISLVAQAYQGYMTDLRIGKYVGTDTEKAIVAIVINRCDLVGDFDRAFGKWIFENHEERYQGLLTEVFSD